MPSPSNQGKNVNRVILWPKDLVSSESNSEERYFLEKQDDRFIHLKEHLKSQKGDELKVTLFQQGLCRARVIEMNERGVLLEICSATQKGLERNLHLYLAYCRPPSLKKILEHGVGFPLKNLSLFHADLSEKSFAQSKVLQGENLTKLLTYGLSQCGTYHDWPEVHSTQERLEKVLEGLKGLDDSQTFFLDQNASLTFSDVTAKPEPLNLFIGPERGWTERERACFYERGIKPLKVSRSILRVEMAVFSALGQLELVQQLQ